MREGGAERRSRAGGGRAHRSPFPSKKKRRRETLEASSPKPLPLSSPSKKFSSNLFLPCWRFFVGACPRHPLSHSVPRVRRHERRRVPRRHRARHSRGCRRSMPPSRWRARFRSRSPPTARACSSCRAAPAPASASTTSSARSPARATRSTSRSRSGSSSRRRPSSSSSRPSPRRAFFSPGERAAAGFSPRAPSAGRARRRLSPRGLRLEREHRRPPRAARRSLRHRRGGGSPADASFAGAARSRIALAAVVLAAGAESALRARPRDLVRKPPLRRSRRRPGDPLGLERGLGPGAGQALRARPARRPRARRTRLAHRGRVRRACRRASSGRSWSRTRRSTRSSSRASSGTCAAAAEKNTETYPKFVWLRGWLPPLRRGLEARAISIEPFGDTQLLMRLRAATPPTASPSAPPAPTR